MACVALFPTGSGIVVGGAPPRVAEAFRAAGWSLATFPFLFRCDGKDNFFIFEDLRILIPIIGTEEREVTNLLGEQVVISVPIYGSPPPEVLALFPSTIVPRPAAPTVDLTQPRQGTTNIEDRLSERVEAGILSQGLDSLLFPSLHRQDDPGTEDRDLATQLSPRDEFPGLFSRR